jgi:hypothetical protein
MRYFYGVLVFLLLMGPALTSALASPESAPAAVVPTISIVSVVPDVSVTIRTHNYPANQTFTARMGPMGTRGVGGTVVGTTPSGAGGSFEATYPIPADLHGARQIAIRLDSPAGFFSFNWFYNQTTAPAVTPGPGTPVATRAPVPTITILNVVRDQTVTVRTHNYPANQTFTARMGPMGTRAVGGTVVGTTDSGAGGSFEVTFDIPAVLHGARQVAIRLDSPAGFFSYNWFYNNTTTPAATPAPGTPAPTPGPIFRGIPTFGIIGVVQDQTVTIRTNNFPPNQTFTARMGPMGTRGIGGTVVGTTDSGAGGVLEVTYEIPAALRGSRQIAIRLDSPAGFFAYNWFYNNTYP